MDEQEKYILVVSDGTGETAKRVLDAALIQFKHRLVRQETFPSIRSAEQINKVLEIAKKENGMVVHTLVDTKVREMLVSRAAIIGVGTVDIIGSLIEKLSNFFDLRPKELPGLSRSLDERYFRTMEAIEFAVKNDDGQEPRNLHDANIILVGLSRTSKTPLSIYLAHKGYKVANVPLVALVPPPETLFQVDQSKVFGLEIDMAQLLKIRKNRLRSMGMKKSITYAETSGVREELLWCKRLYEENPQWTILNVTDRAVEETASIILQKVSKSKIL